MRILGPTRATITLGLITHEAYVGRQNAVVQLLAICLI